MRGLRQLKLCRIVRSSEKKVDVHHRVGSQVQCAVIDSINRKKVQHVVCSSKRPGVNRAIKALHKRTSGSECGFSRGCKSFRK